MALVDLQFLLQELQVPFSLLPHHVLQMVFLPLKSASRPTEVCLKVSTWCTAGRFLGIVVALLLTRAHRN